MKDQSIITIGDILKSEADFNSRVAITAPAGTQIGHLVDYTPRNQKLVALSNEEHGQVLVQPHNCVIDLTYVTLGSVTADTLVTEGDAHGIKYITQTTTKTAKSKPAKAGTGG